MGCLAGKPAQNLDIDSPPLPVLVSMESTYLSKKGSFLEDYKIIRVIAPNEYRRVLEVEEKTTGKRFVLKEVSVMKEAGRDEELLKEVRIITSLTHPNLIKLMEVYQDKHKYYLILEYLAGGELFEYISQCKFLNEAMAANIMRQLLSAVAYCHERRVVLRNIKPENILLASQPTTPEDIHIKLADFGISTLLTGQRYLHKIIGTELYTAPEVFSGGYDEACDAWSCGVVLYVMLSGMLPFNGSSQEEIQGKVRSGVYSLDSSHWAIVSPEAKDLIRKLLVVEPGYRLSPAEALNHPWVAAHQAVDLVQAAKSQGLLFELRKFQGEKKLKQAIGGYITDRYAHQDLLAEQRLHFETLDKDHNGVLSRWELIEALSTKMPLEEAAKQVDEILTQMDVDKSRSIDYSEFISAASLHTKMLSLKALESAFEVLDTNHDGKLSAKELQHLLGQAVHGGDKAIASLLAQADANQDGQLSLKEFIALMMEK